jgi:hypothetical protein
MHRNATLLETLESLKRQGVAGSVSHFILPTSPVIPNL